MQDNIYAAAMQVLPGCQESRWLAPKPPKQAQVSSQCMCHTNSAYIAAHSEVGASLALHSAV